MSLPFALVHVRIAGVAATLAETEALRDAIHAVVAAQTETYGVRIKRRCISAADGDALYARYRARAAQHEMVE